MVKKNNILRIVLFGVFIVACSFLQILAIYVDKKFGLPSVALQISKIALIAGLIIYALYFVNFKEKKYPLDLKYQAYTFLIIAVNLFLFMKKINYAGTPLSIITSVFSLITSVVLEELLFRIIALSTFKDAGNSVSTIKIIIISLLYAFYHFAFIFGDMGNWEYYLMKMIYAFFFGFFLFVIYFTTSDIKYSLSINAAIKGIILVFTVFSTEIDVSRVLIKDFAFLVSLIMYASLGFLIWKNNKELK